MGDWDDPVQRAAVWYLAAFAALASVLLAGVQLSSFQWDKASNPVIAALAVVLAVASAFVVIYLASRVLLPRYTVKDLLDRQRAAEARLSDEHKARESAWNATASHDKVLKELWLDGYRQESDAPMALTALTNAGSAEARESLQGMLTTANRREIRSAFRVLRRATPFATAVLLICVLVWPSASAREEGTASAAKPIPVSITLISGRDPQRIISPRCTQRVLTGVAVNGNIENGPLVAIPDQGDCQAVLLRVDPTVGVVTRVP